jgi:predicted ArsR family transcriptional regulator
MTRVSTEERVIEALARSEGGISTPQAIAAQLGLNAKTISNHFTALHKKGRVETSRRWAVAFPWILLSKGTRFGRQFAFRCWRACGFKEEVSLIE